jgi:FtsH-binding integral membrane protein
MSRSQREYQRLPGRGRTLLGSSTLWLGPDHLLAVDGRGYSETYRRFYYRDIQAIASGRTSRWLAMASLLGLAVAAVGWGFFATSSELRWIWAIPAVPLLLLFILNLLYGPTCVCRITTAAQTVRLPSLTRASRARRAFDRIRARVEAEQGAWAGEAPIAGPPEPAAEGLSAPALSLPHLPQPPSLPARRDTTLLHRVLFWSLIADSALTVVSLTLKESGAYIAGAALLVVEFGLAIAAIVRQRRTDIPKGVRGLVWATLVYLCLSVALIFFATWFAAFRAITSQAGAPSVTGGRNLVLDLFGVLAPLLLGTSGLVLLHRFSSDREESDLSMFSRS